MQRSALPVPPKPRRRRLPGRRDDRSAFGSFEYFLRQRTAVFGRVALLTAVVAVLAFGAVSVGLAFRQYQHAERSAATDLQARVVATAALVDVSFAGQVATLTSLAEASAVVRGDVPAMSAYFRRVQRSTQLFTGSIGWIDRSGLVRATSSSGGSEVPVRVADRAYFRQVLATGKPYVSGGLVGRTNRKALVVTAVPTRDASGRITGVLAGSLRVAALKRTKSAETLGFADLKIVDRSGHQLFSQLAPVRNLALLRRARGAGDGVITGGPGFSGQGKDVVAYAAAPLPSWTIAIDRPERVVYAAARRSLELELVSVAVVTLLVFGLLAYFLRRVRADAAANELRAAAWSGLTRSLGGATTPDEVAEALLSGLRAAFPAGLPVVALFDGNDLMVKTPAEGRWQRLVRDKNTMARIALFAAGGEQSALLEREPLLDDVHWLSGRRLCALHGLPILDADGAAIGTLTLLTPEPLPLGESEWALLSSFAEQGSQAVARSRLFEHEHDVAVSLQRSLLPDQLPLIDGIVLGGRYRAGGTGVEVGGDWYDAVRRSDGLIHLSVGDVIGKGIGAAVLMGRYRNAFSAYANDCVSPADIVTRMARHVDSDEMIITMACVTLDPYTRELTYCCAGHPPPLLVDRATRAVTRLDRASSPPLGVDDAAGVVEATSVAPEGGVLALYTDGLIERRGRNLDEGIDLLGSVLADHDDATADSALQRTSEAIGQPSDDVALLVATLLGAPVRFDVELPADPAVLPGLRRRLSGWLARLGVEPAVTGEIVLAVAEACNNAVEHAYAGAGGTGTVAICVSELDGTIRATVEDRGEWGGGSHDAFRGRGIPIMQALMDSVVIEDLPVGTRVSLERRI